MRRSALLGLVLSLVLGGLTVFETSEEMHARRNGEDRALQSAISGEIARIADGEHQTSTALSLMLVNPAVRELLTDSAVAPALAGADRADTALSLATIERSSFVPLSAACLDDRHGRQVVCAPTAHSVAFPRTLTRQFLAIAAGAPIGATSGAFLSPVNGRLSVAFLAPFRVRGRTLGVVHLDIDVAATRQSSLLVNDTPSVRVQLGSFEGGHVSLGGSAATIGPGGLGAPHMLRVDGPIGQGSQSTFNAGHRAMVVALPLTIGSGRQRMAVAATFARPNPDLLNTWRAGLLALLAFATVLLLGSIAGLVVSHRRVVRELSTDALTGLHNRRALIETLERVCQRATEHQPAYLWFFDLNGFKTYNDSFGHLAGDALLTRLGMRLRDVVGTYGTVHRLGGDEFCVLLTGPVEDPHELYQQARDALTEEGGAFSVTSASGAVEIPRDTADPTQALRLADQHMYREKATGRGGSAELITSVLHAALAQRHPELGEHSDDVAGDVELLARTIGLDEDTIGLIIKAGGLHDVGKLGIPDEIIAKPGALTEEEWTFMKRHTVMGEQIIAAAGPSLERIGPLVRASHERWDGNGYPDGLAGEQIPLGARIIAICDSFRAMLDERPYKRAMPIDEALAELRRCAGTQFDPRLVQIFCRIVSERIGPAAAVDRPTAGPPRAGRPARAPRRPATARR